MSNRRSLREQFSGELLQAVEPDEIVATYEATKILGEARPRIHLVPFEKIKLTKRRRDLVKGVFPRVGPSIVWGPPKCGKSFWLYDLLMHVALGWSYRGRRVDQGPVIYCAFEGQSGFEARVEAFRISFLRDHSEPVPFYLQPVTLDLVNDHQKLISVIRASLGSQRPVAVALDTLNRSLRGSESNDQDMARYIIAADAIRDAFECAVPIVHHCGIDGSRPRGHSSLTGAADAQIAVRRDANNNIVATVEDVKDGASGEIIVSQLKIVDVGTDQDGDFISSCIVVPSEDDVVPVGKSKQKVSAKADLAHRALHNCIAEVGTSPPAGSRAPATVKGVTLNQWRDELMKVAIINRSGSYREEFRRLHVTLRKAALICIYEEFVWPVT